MASIGNILSAPGSYIGIACAAINPANYLGSVRFDPEKDIADLSGKVVLVTGGKDASQT